ncbi:MAG: cytochrome c [Acidobacteriaceae bacterium]|nr:cytochrome c [Acidobacteriaceae bacterium]
MLKSLFVLGVLFFFAVPPQQSTQAPSAIPAEAAGAVNPVKSTAESQTRAMKTYGYDCAMCHGEKGDGKGEAVADMKLKLKDWTDPAALKDMTDGELFYIIRNGKGQMPSDGDRIKPDDIWHLVILVRSFSSGAAAPAESAPNTK